MKIWKTGKNKEKLEDMKIDVFLEQQKNDVRKSYLVADLGLWDHRRRPLRRHRQILRCEGPDVEKRLGEIFTKKHGGLSGFTLW